MMGCIVAPSTPSMPQTSRASRMHSYYNGDGSAGVGRPVHRYHVCFGGQLGFEIFHVKEAVSDAPRRFMTTMPKTAKDARAIFFLVSL